MRGFPRSLAGVFALVVTALLIWVMQDTAQQPEESIDDSGEVNVAVDSVVDGDTARFWINGESESVRYIGIDTPEMNYGGESPECLGPEATEFNRGLLDRNENVRLVFDREKRDHYGRLLAYVYSGPTLLQAELLKAGYATTIEVPPNTAKADQFQKLEEEARDSKRGIWAECR